MAFTLGEGKFISPRTQLFLRKAKPYAENIYLCMQIVRGVSIRKGCARQLIDREYIPIIYMGAPKAKQSSTLRYARLLSFLSITFTLFMLGALGLVYVLEQGLSKEVRERISFSVELSDEPGANTEATLSELRALPYVRSVELITADSAAKSLTDVLGEDPTKILGYNPLQPMAKVYLKSEYTEPDSLKKIIATNPVLKNAEGLEEQQSQWASASNNLQTIRFVLWIFLGINLLVSFLQITTATGLVIYSQRMRIRTLSLIGATAGFIGRPFIRRAVLEGFVGALLALSFLGGLLYGAEQAFGYRLLSLCPSVPLLGVIIAIPLVGVCVSFVSSWRATRRYIHMEEGKIHLI